MLRLCNLAAGMHSWLCLFKVEISFRCSSLLDPINLVGGLTFMLHFLTIFFWFPSGSRSPVYQWSGCDGQEHSRGKRYPGVSQRSHQLSSVYSLWTGTPELQWEADAGIHVPLVSHDPELTQDRLRCSGDCRNQPLKRRLQLQQSVFFCSVICQ